MPEDILTFSLIVGNRRADDLALVALGVLHLAGREGFNALGAGAAGRWLEAGCKRRDRVGSGMGQLSRIGAELGVGTRSGLRAVSGRNEYQLRFLTATATATDAAAWKRKRDFGWKSGGNGRDGGGTWRIGGVTGAAG